MSAPRAWDLDAVGVVDWFQRLRDARTRDTEELARGVERAVRHFDREWGLIQSEYRGLCDAKESMQRTEAS